MSINDTDALGKQDPRSAWDDTKLKRDFFEEHRQFRQDLYIKESINRRKFVETSWLSCECCYGINRAQAEEHINAVMNEDLLR